MSALTDWRLRHLSTYNLYTVTIFLLEIHSFFGLTWILNPMKKRELVFVAVLVMGTSLKRYILILLNDAWHIALIIVFLQWDICPSKFARFSTYSTIFLVISWYICKMSLMSLFHIDEIYQTIVHLWCYDLCVSMLLKFDIDIWSSYRRVCHISMVLLDNVLWGIKKNICITYYLLT